MNGLVKTRINSGHDVNDIAYFEWSVEFLINLLLQEWYMEPYFVEPDL